MKTSFTFYRTYSPREEANRTEPSLSVSVPWLNVRCHCVAFLLKPPIKIYLMKFPHSSLLRQTVVEQQKETFTITKLSSLQKGQ
jgi:hypothetical protein